MTIVTHEDLIVIIMRCVCDGLWSRWDLGHYVPDWISDVQCEEALQDAFRRGWLTPFDFDHSEQCYVKNPELTPYHGKWRDQEMPRQYFHSTCTGDSVVENIPESLRDRLDEILGISR